MQVKKNFYCYIDKLVCNQAAIFNPSVEIRIGNKQGIMRPSSSTFPTFFFNQKFKCTLTIRDSFDSTSITFIICENSTELMKKSIGFSFLKSGSPCQKVEIQNEDCDRIELYFRAMIDQSKKEPRWFSSLNAEFVNAMVEGVRSIDSSVMDDILLLSSSEDFGENDYLSENDQSQTQTSNQTQTNQLPFYSEIAQNQRIIQSAPDNRPSPPKKLIQPQETCPVPKKVRKQSSISFGEEEDREEEDDFDDDMPSSGDNHEITSIELFVKAKCELLFRAPNDDVGFDIGFEFMKISRVSFTIDQKYAILFLENYIKLTKTKSIEIMNRFFSSLLITYQIVLSNKRLSVQIKRILKILIEKVFSSQSKDMISYTINALKVGPSSKSFNTNANKILKMRRAFTGDSGQLLFSKVNEYLDCEICNLMITKMELNTYSIVLAASDNLSHFETLSGLLLPRLRQAFKAVVMRNDVISSPLIVKKQMPLLSSTFVFYLLSVVKPDKTIPQPLPFEKLQRFALTAEVEFRNPIEKCLLKPGRLCLPKTCSKLQTE
ncbi:hypothetical protein M9Y10_009987 [Tritrichomonas musculus]|uniref:C2 NT-type domain-containing protein n=1 Tax=Tritrichomonas musculus TaxID=1915356 RepID=A0ABR2IQT3_9EUKA